MTKLDVRIKDETVFVWCYRYKKRNEQPFLVERPYSVKNPFLYEKKILQQRKNVNSMFDDGFIVVYITADNIGDVQGRIITE